MKNNFIIILVLSLRVAIKKAVGKPIIKHKNVAPVACNIERTNIEMYFHSICGGSSPKSPRSNKNWSYAANVGSQITPPLNSFVRKE